MKKKRPGPTNYQKKEERRPFLRRKKGPSHLVSKGGPRRGANPGNKKNSRTINEREGGAVSFSPKSQKGEKKGSEEGR